MFVVKSQSDSYLNTEAYVCVCRSERDISEEANVGCLSNSEDLLVLMSGC